MPKDNTLTDGDCARVALRLSRRSFLHIAAAGTAAALPAAAIAATGGSPQLPLSNEEQLDACVKQLKGILNRMHSTVAEQHHFLSSRPDGSYHLTFQGYVPFQTFDGAGLYEISLRGYPMIVWLEQSARRRASDGTSIPGFEYFLAYEWSDGKRGALRRDLESADIIRKLSGVAI